jgi:hypothetical protein
MSAMTEYAYDYSKHSSRTISPCYANYSFEHRTNWPMEIQYQNLAWEWYGHYKNSVHLKLSKQLEQSIEVMRKYYDKKRKSIGPFKTGELAMLNGRNNRGKNRCQRLEYMMYGHLKVISVG